MMPASKRHPRSNTAGPRPNPSPGFERLELEPVPTRLSHPARAGREWLGRWRRPAEGGTGRGGPVASKL
jgi:hypothetical protein